MVRYLKKPVYSLKCPVFEWSAKSHDYHFNTGHPDGPIFRWIRYSGVRYSEGYCIQSFWKARHDELIHDSLCIIMKCFENKQLKNERRKFFSPIGTGTMFPRNLKPVYSPGPFKETLPKIRQTFKKTWVWINSPSYASTRLMCYIIFFLFQLAKTS